MESSETNRELRLVLGLTPVNLPIDMSVCMKRAHKLGEKGGGREEDMHRIKDKTRTRVEKNKRDEESMTAVESFRLEEE